MEALLGLGLVAALLWLWQDSLRAREAATRAAKRDCMRADLQFLDGTVVQGGWRLRRDAGRLRLQRLYYFDYTDSGDDRHRGYVLLIGGRVESVERPLAEH
jgi:hypothetical protein